MGFSCRKMASAIADLEMCYNFAAPLPTANYDYVVIVLLCCDALGVIETNLIFIGSNCGVKVAQCHAPRRGLGHHQRITLWRDLPVPGDTRDAMFCLTESRTGCGKARAQNLLRRPRRVSAPTPQARGLRIPSTAGR
jgi:hypothetical protein